MGKQADLKGVNHHMGFGLEAALEVLLRASKQALIQCLFAGVGRGEGLLEAAYILCFLLIPPLLPLLPAQTCFRAQCR